MKNICIIGLGQQSKELYLPAAIESASVNIVGVMSTTQPTVDSVLLGRNLKGYTNLQ